MIPHILKKDWKLTWPLVAVLMIFHALTQAMFLLGGHFWNNATLYLFMELMSGITALMAVVLITVVVQIDTVPGLRQGWLIRPVERRDLLLAKLSYIVFLILLPYILSNVVGSMLQGFTLPESLLASVSRGIFVFFMFFLPMFALASLTRNLIEAILGVAAIFLIGGTCILAANLVSPNGQLRLDVMWSGLRWMCEFSKFIYTLVGGVLLLWLQYKRRRTLMGMWIFGFGVVLWFLTSMLPWRASFLLQEQMSAAPSAAAPLQMAFDPAQARYRPTDMTSGGVSPFFKSSARGAEMENVIYLPLRVTGMTQANLLFTDSIEVRLQTPDGGSHVLTSEPLTIRPDEMSAVKGPVYHAIHVPPALYEQWKDKAVRLEIEYFATVFEQGRTMTIAAVNGDVREPGVGWCKTQLNSAQTSVRLRCLQPGKGPSCGLVYLEVSTSGLKNPVANVCQPDYTPFFSYPRVILPDAISHYGGNLPFRDPNGLAKYPVGSAQLEHARVVSRYFEPQAHFIREVSISAIRLRDWGAEGAMQVSQLR